MLLSAEVGGKALKVKVSPEVGRRVGREIWLECPLHWVRVFGPDGKLLKAELTEVAG